VDTIVFPTVRESVERGNAGTVIGGGGLTGAAVRGGVLTLPNGKQVRPDAVLIDDPQTRKSAKSAAQNQEREDILNGDLMGMAGPNTTIAAMCACTVIYRNDLADRLLDRERSAAWTTIRVPMIKTWPASMKLWEQYDSVRRQELLEEIERGSANRFYEEHRADMDEGAETYWEHRISPGRLSAIQSAMDDYFSDPRSFMAEKQNAPDAAMESDLPELSSLELARRVTATKRREVPPDATRITAHVDVQQRVLFWMVVAWNEQFSGTVIDYGAFPEQARRHFTLREIKRELSDHYKGFDSQAALRQAIADTIQKLNAKVWVRADKAEMRIDRGLVDARYETDTVEAGIRHSQATNWLPSYGVGIGAKDAPISKWTKKRGVRFGNHCVVQKPDRRLFIGVFYDTNFWKSFLHQALSVPVGHQHAIAYYKESQSHHQLLADHLVSEKAVRVEARGRIVDEWESNSFAPDNHYLDCLVGCCVSASLLGIKRTTDEPAKRTEQPAKPQRRISSLRI